jgi:hypothetical protein
MDLLIAQPEFGAEITEAIPIILPIPIEVDCSVDTTL